MSGGIKNRDQRQIQCLSNYLNPDSPTFMNLKGSGIAAGFGESYSQQLANKMPEWLTERVQDSSLLAKAERNLREMVDMDIKEDVIGAFGPVFDRKTKEVCKKDNTKKLAIKADMTKFALERLNKKKYAPKAEIEAPPVVINIGIEAMLAKVYGRSNQTGETPEQ